MFKIILILFSIQILLFCLNERIEDCNIIEEKKMKKKGEMSSHNFDEFEF